MTTTPPLNEVLTPETVGLLIEDDVLLVVRADGFLRSHGADNGAHVRFHRSDDGFVEIQEALGGGTSPSRFAFVSRPAQPVGQPKGIHSTDTLSSPLDGAIERLGHAIYIACSVDQPQADQVANFLAQPGSAALLAEITRLQSAAKDGDAERDRLRERLVAILDWADFALARPTEFNSHGVRNLDGPVFDAARALLEEFDDALDALNPGGE